MFFFSRIYVPAISRHVVFKKVSVWIDIIFCSKSFLKFGLFWSPAFLSVSVYFYSSTSKLFNVSEFPQYSRMRSYNFDAFSKPFTVTQFPLYQTRAISTAFRDRSLTVVCISAWLFSLHSRFFHRLGHYQQYQSRTISTVLESHNCNSAVICITVLASTEQSTVFKLAYHTASTEC